MAAPARVAPAPRRTSRRQAAARPAPRPSLEPKRPSRAAARPHLAGGVVWIVFIAALLAGIVALNVAALRVNLEVQQLNERKARLVEENAATASEISSLAASARVEAIAREKLGLVPPEETTYLRLPRRSR